MRRTFILYLLTVIAILGLQAQTQQGYIRTIGRPDKKGEPLANVSIRLKGEHNAVLSSNDGKFALVMHGKKNGDSYSLQQVRKKGYLLNDAGVIGRSFAFSDRIPHTILMVSATQLQKDKQRIENNAYRVAEKNFEEKLTKLEQEVNDSIISAEKYREELLTLQKSFEKYQLLIEGLADHYAHTDYDNLNEREREINLCIENGELDRADSLIHTLFNPLEVLKRNKEAMLHIEQQISQANAIIANADIEMAKVIKQQNKEAEYLYHLYTIALARFDNKNAEYYIETRAELDTANAGWQFDAAYYAHKQNRHKSAEFYYTRALASSKELARKDPQAHEPEVASILNNLASLYIDIQRHTDSEKTYKETLEIYRRLAKENPEVYEPDVARTLNNLALLYSDMKRYEESIEMYKEALAIRRGLAQENPQAHSMSVAMTLNNLASLYYSTKQIPESEPLYREAVEIYRELAKTTPQQHKPYLAQTLNNLASLYQSTKRASEAEELYKEAIETYRSLATDNPQTYEPDVARALNNLASLYSDTKRYAEGEALYNEALAIRRRLAEKSPEYFEQAVALTQYNLGMLYLRDKQYTKGLVSFEEALSIYRRLAIEEPMMQLHYTNSLKWVVQLYKNTKEKHKSYDVYEEYMPIIKSNYEKRPDIYRTEYLKALAYHASQCLEMDKYTKAEEYTREELNINPISMQAYRNLAILLVLQERYAEAEEIYFKYKPKLKNEFNADLKLYKKAKKITKKHKAGLRRINLILYDR